MVLHQVNYTICSYVLCAIRIQFLLYQNFLDNIWYSLPQYHPLYKFATSAHQINGRDFRPRFRLGGLSGPSSSFEFKWAQFRLAEAYLSPGNCSEQKLWVLLQPLHMGFAVQPTPFLMSHLDRNSPRSKSFCNQLIKSAQFRPTDLKKFTGPKQVVMACTCSGPARFFW